MTQRSRAPRLTPPDLSRVRPWLRGALTRNLGFKVLAVLFAFSGWAMVQGQQVVEKKARVQVHWSLPEGLALVDEVPDSLMLTVSGSQVFVRNIRRADMHMRVDLSDASVGVQAVEFEDRFIENLPQNVNVVGISPTRVEFELDEKVAKLVKVSPNVLGEPPAGFRLLDISVQPDTVELVGPASALVGVSEVATRNIQLSNFEDASPREVLLGRLPYGVSRMDTEPLEVTVRLQSTTSKARFESVPVVVRSAGWETDVRTVTIAVSGPLHVIETLRPEDILATISVNPDVEPQPLVAARGDGPARIGIMLNNADRITIEKVVPSSIELRPVQ
jgi:YbbR domain-containing protein